MDDDPTSTAAVDAVGTGIGSASRDRQRSPSLSTELVALARSQYTVIRGTDAQTYAVARTNPGIAIPLRGSRDGLRQQLAAAYFDQRGRAATALALADVLNVVEGDALRADVFRSTCGSPPSTAPCTSTAPPRLAFRSCCDDQGRVSVG